MVHRSRHYDWKLKNDLRYRTVIKCDRRSFNATGLQLKCDSKPHRIITFGDFLSHEFRYHIQTALKTYCIDAGYNDYTCMQVSLSHCNCLYWTRIESICLREHVQLKESNRLMDTLKTWRCTEAKDVTSINLGEQNNQGRSEEQATASQVCNTNTEEESRRSNSQGRGLIGQCHTAQIRSGRRLSVDIRESVTHTI